MTRQQDPAGATTHDRLLQALRDFLNDGAEDDVALRAIAKRAGVSLGTVSYYFPTRETLMEAAFTAMYTSFGAIAWKYLASIQAGRILTDVIPDFTAELFREARRHRGLIILRMRRVTSGAAEVYDTKQLNEQIIQAARAWFTSQGVVDDARARLLARTIMAVFTGYVVARSEDLANWLGMSDTATAEGEVITHLSEMMTLLLGLLMSHRGS